MTVEPDEILLRKKARRRLIGAILLTLVVVLSLPLVLEDPSRPLGDGPEIVIPEPAAVEPPRANPVPDSLPDDNVGDEALPVETGLPPPATPPAPPTAAKPAAPVAAPATAPAPAAVTPPAKVAPPAAAPSPAQPPARPPVPAAAPASAAASPPAAPPAPASAARIYLLQLGVFKERANAESVAAKAATLGLQPAIAQTESGSWRVGLGPYADKTEALAVRDKVRDAGLQVVVKTP